MTITLPPEAQDAIERGWNSCSGETSLFAAYGLKDLPKEKVQEVCDEATEIYTRHVFSKSRLDPKMEGISDIFTVKDGSFETIEDCTNNFIKLLLEGLDKGDKWISIHPLAFVVIAQEYLPNVTLVLGYKRRGTWYMEHRSVSITANPEYAYLAMDLRSLSLVDKFPEDILDRYASEGQTKIEDLRREDAKELTFDKRAFALFSAGLEGAATLPDLIDPFNEQVNLSEVTVDMFHDPERYGVVSRERMLELFPFVLQRDERRAWRSNGLALHRKVFMCCDNDNLKENGLLIMEMEWDGNLEQSEEQLMAIGRHANVKETRVKLEDALVKAREIADHLI